MESENRVCEGSRGLWALPYLPPPYEDEILGSWMARARLLNGSGGWRAMLAGIGVDRRLHLYPFDFVAYNKTLGELLSGSISLYSSIHVQRTTLPYWSGLIGDSVERVPHVQGLPMPRSRLGVIHDLSSFACVGLGKLRGQRWFCPCCVALDRAERRVPYFRRTHQLPTVFYCPKHNVALLQGCPQCKAAIALARRDRISLIETTCSCGFEIAGEERPKREVHAFFHRLADVSVEALSSTNVGWDPQRVRAWLWDRAGISFGQSGLHAWEKLVNRVPGGRVDATRVRIAVPGTDQDLVVARELKTAQGVAVLLALLNIRLCEAVAAATSSQRAKASETRALPYSRVDADSLTAPKARLLLAQGVKAGVPPSRQKLVYWYLRLFDAEWMERQADQKYRDPIPSVRSDRHLVRAHFEAPGAYATLRTQRALIRAKLRDRAWIEDYGAKRKKAFKQRDASLRLNQLNQRRHAIRQAIQLMASDSNFPQRITNPKLGKIANLSEHQVRATLASDKQLVDLIAEQNESKVFRQLEWAVNKLAKTGAPFGPKLVFQTAKLPPTPRTTPFANRLIASAVRKKTQSTKSEQ